MTLFRGISAFPITPADEDGVVDAEGVAALASRLATSGVGSIGLLGSTGAYAYLTRAERRRAVHAAVIAVGGRVPVMVGVGALRTDVAQQLARDAAEEGADGLLMAPMSYTPLNQDEVYSHYVAVSSSTRLPMCVYNNPSTTHFTFSTHLLERIAALPGIAAVKMPMPLGHAVGAELTELRAGPAGVLAIGYSGDRGLVDALSAGADGFYSVLAGFLPEAALMVADGIAAGRRCEVERLDFGLQPLFRLFNELGGLRVAYAAVDALGLCNAKPPRPILPVAEDDRRRVVLALDAVRAAL